MLTDEQIEMVEALIGDTSNPYFERYLLHEITPKHICPVCGAVIDDYVTFRYHILITHKDQLDTKEVQDALNPITKVRLSCEMNSDDVALTMGKFFGDIISSSHNQHALINIIGKTGMGKSNAAMRIGIEVANYLANKLGGTPEKYFSINNVAIMKLDSIIPIIEDLDNMRYNIIILDDIGASYGARDFQNKINKNINKIFQTFRDTNTLVIMTMPDTFLIDKVARKLAHFQIELTEKRHDQGVSIGKLLQLKENYRGDGKTHFHFIVGPDGTKYTRIVFKRVDKEFADKYEKKRTEIRQSMQAASIANIRNAENDDSEESKELNELPAYQKYAAEIDLELTINPNISARALGKKFEISKDTAIKAKEYVLEMRKNKIAANGGEMQSLI